jgi:membrane-associated phospholipid phosphatase
VSAAGVAAIVAPGFARSTATNGAAVAEAHVVPDPRSLVSRLFHFQPTLRDGFLMLVAGLALHMASLAGIEQFVHTFPSVPDVLHSNLPYVDFGVPGELLYAAFLVTITAVLLKRQPRTVAGILFLLGVFYGLRGVFLFVLPLGMPPTAPPLESRFVLWPFPGHAYFPGGHTGMMTVLSFSVVSRSWRRAFLVATLAFAFGTLLSRTHYTGDALGGWCIGYAIVLWGRRHVVMRPASYSAKGESPWSAAARHEQEA